jgi:hypothetical protein
VGNEHAARPLEAQPGRAAQNCHDLRGLRAKSRKMTREKGADLEATARSRYCCCFYYYQLREQAQKRKKGAEFKKKRKEVKNQQKKRKFKKKEK